MGAVDEFYHPKLGKSVATDVVVDGTVRSAATALPVGNYQIRSTVDAFAIQCSKVGYDANAAVSAALLRAQGTPLPAGVEVEFRVSAPTAADQTPDATNGDGYLYIVKDASASDGTARILSCTRVVTAVLV